MRWNSHVVVLLGTAIAGVGCRDDEARSVSARATERAEQIAEVPSETTLTSATFDAAPTAEMEALQADQDAYRRRLTSALDKIEGRHGPTKDARRDVLKQDLVAIDGSSRETWPVLKAKIDRDLEVKR